MSESVYSSSWYRVADLKPRLRSHVQIHRHRYRGQKSDEKDRRHEAGSGLDVGGERAVGVYLGQLFRFVFAAEIAAGVRHDDRLELGENLVTVRPRRAQSQQELETVVVATNGNAELGEMKGGPL